MENSNMAAAALQLVLLFTLLQSNLPNTAAQSNNMQDFSYMKSVKNATDMPLEAQYDYIIVGGGTAGCPLAATLSEKYSVLVLERGGVPLDYPDVLNAAGFETILGLEDDGDTPSQGFTSEDGVANARARILGGGTMINGAFYSRADQEFYANSGIDWDTNAVNQSYKWVEETVAKRSDLFPWNAVVREALLQSNVVPDNGFTLDHLVGTKVSASTFDGLGRRFGAVELLNKAVLANLQVAVRATVERIIFSSYPSSSKVYAKGVKYTDSEGRSHQATVRENGEVILSAGALGSPQLLLLSGVGPKSYLSSLNISVVLDQPYVGKFVRDNPCNVIAFTSPLPINESFIQVVGITNNLTFIETRSNPSIALIFTKVAGPLSTGSFSLASSTNVTVTPKVRYNYYSEPLDLARCVNVIRKVGEMLDAPSLERFKTFNTTTGVTDYQFFGTPPPTNQSSDADVEAYCRDTVTTIWHYHGGCVVGKVVDGSLRVKGIDGLRVVDGSTFTQSPGTNPQATLMMLGRYIGVKMLKQIKA